MGIKFFETIVGRRFVEGTVPKILEQIVTLNKNLEKLNNLLEEGQRKDDDKDEHKDS